MHIPSSLAHPPAFLGEAHARADGPARTYGEARSPAVKLELSPLARRSSFPPSPDLKELAAGLEPRERAQQLAAALEGPGVPVAMKLATLKMMLAGEMVEVDPPSSEGPESGVSSSHDGRGAYRFFDLAQADETQAQTLEAQGDPRPKVPVPTVPTAAAEGGFAPNRLSFETEA